MKQIIRQLKARMAAVPQVVHTGYITGNPLNQVFSHAGLFVLPSYHEGLPIALLEAMSFGLPVLVSDIPANREVNLPKERYFRCGYVPDLAGKLAALMSRPRGLRYCSYWALGRAALRWCIWLANIYRQGYHQFKTLN